MRDVGSNSLQFLQKTMVQSSTLTTSKFNSSRHKPLSIKVGEEKKTIYIYIYMEVVGVGKPGDVFDGEAIGFGAGTDERIWYFLVELFQDFRKGSAYS